jgi:hypothetical protein
MPRLVTGEHRPIADRCGGEEESFAHRSLVPGNCRAFSS